jgi:hypothetical protein
VKLQQDLREFVELLSSSGVEFIVVGGHAVAFHGYPRFTGDIDFWVRSTPENAERVIAALRAFGFGDVGLSVGDFTRHGSVVQLGRPPNRIDLLTSLSGVDFEEAWESKIAAALDGLPVFFLSLDILLRNKRASGRDKDLVDLKKLQAINDKTEGGDETR